MLPSLTATRRELSGCPIQETKTSGVLFASHRPRIVSSFRWSATQSSAIDRLITSQATRASSGVAARISNDIVGDIPFLFGCGHRKHPSRGPGVRAAALYHARLAHAANAR